MIRIRYLVLGVAAGMPERAALRPSPSWTAAGWARLSWEGAFQIDIGKRELVPPVQEGRPACGNLFPAPPDKVAAPPAAAINLVIEGSSPNPVESRVDSDFFAAGDSPPGDGLVSTLPSHPAVHPMLGGIAQNDGHRINGGTRYALHSS